MELIYDILNNVHKQLDKLWDHAYYFSNDPYVVDSVEGLYKDMEKIEHQVIAIENSIRDEYAQDKEDEEINYDDYDDYDEYN